MRIFLLSVFLAATFFLITAQPPEQFPEQFADSERKIKTIKKESQAIEEIILQPDAVKLAAAEPIIAVQ